MPFTLPDRIKALPPYLFVDIDRKKQAAIDAGKDVITFGIGDPDLPTYAFIVDRMQEATRKAEYHRYPHDQGATAFRKAAAGFLERRYGVALDPDREILAVIGSKEGLGHLPLAVLNPGDGALIPSPSYPVYNATTLFVGGVPIPVPLLEVNGWLPDFGAIDSDAVRSAKLLYLNYPNNPTGAVATREFFEEAVAFARSHDLIIASDAAYSEMYYGDYRPPSVLEVAGGKDVAVEFHSLSKTFNMTGWRIGFAAGNADVVGALAKIKSNLDSCQFTAIQDAATVALEGYDRPEIEQQRAVYAERAETLVPGLRELGFQVEMPKATFFVWCGVPDGYTSMDLVAKVLDEAGVVCVPGAGFGPTGEGYVRFALTVSVERTREALERMRKLQW